MSKSYVGMEGARCPICGEIHSTGVLLNKRMKETFEDGKTYVTGIELCPEHDKKLNEEDFVAFVAIDPEKSEFNEGGETLSFENAYMLGKYALLKEEALKKLLDLEIPENRILYCGTELVDRLERLQEINNVD